MTTHGADKDDDAVFIHPSQRQSTPPSWNLQHSISLLNDFCADIKIFSYTKLAKLKLNGLWITVDPEKQTLTLAVTRDVDYQTLQRNLTPSKRLYELLSLHFKKIHLAFKLKDEHLDKTIILDTLPLIPPQTIAPEPAVRDDDELGARLRRALNMAMQGHIVLLKLRHQDDIDKLKAIWERGRIVQLIERFGIIAVEEKPNELIKLWKPGYVKEHPASPLLIE